MQRQPYMVSAFHQVPTWPSHVWVCPATGSLHFLRAFPCPQIQDGSLANVGPPSNNPPSLLQLSYTSPAMPLANLTRVISPTLIFPFLNSREQEWGIERHGTLLNLDMYRWRRPAAKTHNDLHTSSAYFLNKYQPFPTCLAMIPLLPHPFFPSPQGCWRLV